MREDATPVRLNLALAGGLAAVHLLALVAVPVLLLRSPWWGLLLLGPVAVTPTLWSLTHEAIHGSLHPDRAWNDRLGRGLAGIFGAPFQILRLGHLMHHRFNRSPLNRADVAKGAPPTPLERARYFGRLLGGLYLSELLSAPLAILPDRSYRWIVRLGFEAELEDGRSMWPAAERQLLEEPGRRRMRAEGLAVTLGLGLAFAVFGAYWWMLALAILARALVVSGLDNVYHYGNALDEVRAGSDLRLPAVLRAWFLNFNYHGTHHQRPNLPWTALPAAFAALDRRFAGGFGPATLRQLKGPIPERAFAAKPPRVRP
jgi:fatty acid desaturase